jgi:hypothetical protein
MNLLFPNHTAKFEVKFGFSLSISCLIQPIARSFLCRTEQVPVWFHKQTHNQFLSRVVG